MDIDVYDPVIDVAFLQSLPNLSKVSAKSLTQWTGILQKEMIFRLSAFIALAPTEQQGLGLPVGVIGALRSRAGHNSLRYLPPSVSVVVPETSFRR